MSDSVSLVISTCDTCRALVYAVDMEAHEEWHRTLTEALEKIGRRAKAGLRRALRA